jgi:hypothetical protein
LHHDRKDFSLSPLLAEVPVYNITRQLRPSCLSNVIFNPMILIHFNMDTWTQQLHRTLKLLLRSRDGVWIVRTSNIPRLQAFRLAVHHNWILDRFGMLLCNTASFD